jgi:hypothetical protein
MRNAFAVSSPNVTALRALNYAPAVEAFRAKANRRRCRTFGDLLADLGPNYGSVFTRIDCERQHGVELLSQSDMFATEPEGRVIRRDCIPRPDAHRIQRWQVLIAGAGTLGENELYGRALIADRRLVDRYVGPHAMVMTFKSPDESDSLYAYAFLCTPTGIQCVRAASYGTKVLSLRSEMLSNLPIPFARDEIVERVARLVKSTVLNREAYAKAIGAARAVINEIPEVQIATQMCGQRKASCLAYEGPLSTTIAAWNYASSGGALPFLLKKWTGRLKDNVKLGGVFNGPRFARVSCAAPFGVDFWSQRDVFLARPIPRRIMHPGVDDRLLFVPDDAILMGSHGQIADGNLFGKAELASFGASSGAITQDILRLLPKEGCSEFLYTFLSTKLGIALVRSCAIGTSIPMMHTGLLRELPMPQLGAEALKRVKHHVAQAVAARVAATQAETESIRIIEQEVLPEWLN